MEYLERHHTLRLPVRGNTSHTPGDITGRRAGNITVKGTLPSSDGNIPGRPANIPGCVGRVTADWQSRKDIVRGLRVTKLDAKAVR